MMCDSSIWCLPLASSERNGDVEIARALIQGGANVNLQDAQFHDTALRIAADEGHRDFVKVLVEHGVETQQLSDALPSAAASKKLDMVELLVEPPRDPTSPSAGIAASAWCYSDFRASTGSTDTARRAGR
jgi:ankyrin repeat protein